MGAIFLNDHISEDGSQDLEKLFLGSKTDKRLKDLYTFQRDRERIYNGKISEANSLRNWKSEAHSQEEICLKLSQPEGNSKAVLVKAMTLNLYSRLY